MPRSGSGSYTLPSGNPVVTGTTIESTWANTTLSDIATTLTDSLSRSGQGGMTAALRIADGTQGAPGLGFANETGSGLYRAGTGEVWAVVQGAQTMNLDASGVTVPSDKATSIEGTFVFNETGADKDARFEGDTDANLLFVDASADAVGIGTSSPGAKLHVAGTFRQNDATSTYGYTVTTASSKTVTAALFGGGYFAWQTNNSGTDQLTLDSSGNLGLGVTPSAWSVIKAIEIGSFRNSVFSDNGSVSVGIASGSYYNAGWKYAVTGSAVGYYEVAGNAHRWFSAPSGTAGNAISFTQAMTLDASGNLGLGVTSISGFRADILSTSTDAALRARSSNSSEVVRVESTGTSSAQIRFINTSVNNTYISAEGTALAFLTAANERARITSGGDLLVGTATVSGAGGLTYLNQGSTGFASINNNNAGATGYVFSSYRRSSVEIGSITQNGTTAVLFNTTSDRRLKDNIAPAPSASDVIDAIEIVSHDWKSAPDEHVTYGVIAQDLALVAPQAVLQGNDGDEIEKTWGVDYSKLVPMLIKEIQSLRARVAALEAQ